MVMAGLLPMTMVGQNTTSIPQKEGNSISYLSTSLNYISDAIFMGRKDSISAPYLYPSVTYHHKSGFYGTGSFSYLTKPNDSRIDLFLASAGYDFSANNLSGDFSVTKYFFNEASYNVISEIEADITSSLRYDFGNIVNLALDASIYFNKNSGSDFFLSSELSHDFLTTNHKFQFSPMIELHFGSQNFYEEYYNFNRLGNGTRGTGKGKSNTTTTMVTTVTIQESGKFNLMAIQLSFPMWYSHKAITLSLLPMLVLPQNGATIVSDTSVIKEDLENTFYWMAGISYKFGK